MIRTRLREIRSNVVRNGTPHGVSRQITKSHHELPNLSIAPVLQMQLTVRILPEPAV